MMDDIQLKVVDGDELLGLFRSLLFNLFGPHASIPHALDLPALGPIDYLKFYNLVEVAVDGQIGNFMRYTLSETRITHPHTIRRNVKFLRALDYRLSVQTADPFCTVGRVMNDQVSVALFPSQKTRGLCGFGGGVVREKFGDGVRKVVVKLGNLKACLLGLRKRTINLSRHIVQKI